MPITHLTRRQALAGLAGGIAAQAASAPPSYLQRFANEYQSNPRAAAIHWFRQARFGLFLHYGLYSLQERHEWEQFRQKTPVAGYAKLKDRFTAAKFDAGS